MWIIIPKVLVIITRLALLLAHFTANLLKAEKWEQYDNQHFVVDALDNIPGLGMTNCCFNVIENELQDSRRDILSFLLLLQQL